MLRTLVSFTCVFVVSSLAFARGVDLKSEMQAIETFRQIRENVFVSESIEINLSERLKNRFSFGSDKRDEVISLGARGLQMKLIASELSQRIMLVDTTQSAGNTKIIKYSKQGIGDRKIVINKKDLAPAAEIFYEQYSKELNSILGLNLNYVQHSLDKQLSDTTCELKNHKLICESSINLAIKTN